MPTPQPASNTRPRARDLSNSKSVAVAFRKATSCAEYVSQSVFRDLFCSKKTSGGIVYTPIVDTSHHALMPKCPCLGTINNHPARLHKANKAMQPVHSFTHA